MPLPKHKSNAVLQKHIFNTLYLLRLCITNTRLYSINHSKTSELIEKAFTSIKTVLKMTPELSILNIDDDLIVNQKALRPEETEHFKLFITILKQRGIEHITFTAAVTFTGLAKFLAALAATEDIPLPKSPGISSGTLAMKLTANKTQRLSQTAKDIAADRAGPGHRSNTNEDPDEQSREIISKLQTLSNHQLTMAQELFFSIKHDKDVDLRGVQDSMGAFISLFSKNLNPLSLLSSLKQGDEYTFTHVINVCILTLAQAEALGFQEHHLYDIGITATLHDIGKIFIPDEILNKPEKLDNEERRTIETHAVKGAGYILSMPEVPKLSVLAALEHHIRFDGGGYPNIGKNWKPHIVSQMIAIADTFDAMRSTRPYSHAASEDRICEMLTREKGTTFNPMLVENFLNILQRKRPRDY